MLVVLGFWDCLSCCPNQSMMEKAGANPRNSCHMGTARWLVGGGKRLTHTFEGGEADCTRILKPKNLPPTRLGPAQPIDDTLRTRRLPRNLIQSAEDPRQIQDFCWRTICVMWLRAATQQDGAVRAEVVGDLTGAALSTKRGTEA